MEHYSAGKIISNEEIMIAETTRSKVDRKVSFTPHKKKIAWIQETEAALELFYKEKRLLSYSTYTDYYGYNTATASCVKDAADVIERLAIEPDSGLSLRVRRTVKESPYELVSEGGVKKKHKVKEIEDVSSLFLFDAPLLVELKDIMENAKDNSYERLMEIRALIALEPKLVQKNVIVWNSLTGYTETYLKETNGNN